MADETCSTCKFPFQYDNDPVSSFRCSEFCAIATDKELAEFKAAKPGDHCVYPCPECGCPTEGSWLPNEPEQTICSKCAPQVRLRERSELLTETLPYLPSELRARVEKALK